MTEQRYLGRTGISVSKFALGTMHLGAWGNRDHDEGVRMINTAIDAGINVIDTADLYSAGESEEIVGKALKTRRDDVVLATKGHFSLSYPEAIPNRHGNSRLWLTQAVEDSLRRLGTDRIDLYQIHRPDPNTDIDETLSVLSDLVRAGKIMAIGSSGFAAHQLVEARWTAEQRGHIAFGTEQAPYSIFVRGIEAHVLPAAQQYQLGVLTWSPLNSGWLTGRIRKGEQISTAGFRAMITHKFDLDLLGNRLKLDAVEGLVSLADQSGIPLTHLALVFATAHPAVSCAILGPRTLDQLEDQLRACELSLTDDILDRIDEIVAPGTDLNPADTDYSPPALTDSRLRRR